MFDSFFRNLYNSSAAFVQRVDGRIVSVAQLYSATGRYRSRPLRCGVVVGMSTHPRYRQRGLMRKVFEELCAEAQARNYSFIFVPQHLTSLNSALSHLGFQPSFCRALEWKELTPSTRGFSGEIINMQRGEAMLFTKHRERSYISLDPEWVDVAVPKESASSAYHAKVLKTFSGLKSALMIWRDLAPGKVEVLFHCGRPDALFTILRLSGYSDGTMVGFPVAKPGAYAGMVYQISDRFSKEQLDTLFSEVTF